MSRTAQRTLRVTLIHVMACWLALQGVVAVALPFCAHHFTAGVADVITLSGETDDPSGQAMPADHCGTGAVDVSCDDCPACHLAGTPGLPAPSLRLPHLPAPSPGMSTPPMPAPPVAAPDHPPPLAA